MSATRNWCFGGLCTASARGGLVPRGVVPVVVDGLSGDGESDGDAGEEPSPNGSSGGLLACAAILTAAIWPCRVPMAACPRRRWPAPSRWWTAARPKAAVSRFRPMFGAQNGAWRFLIAQTTQFIRPFGLLAPRRCWRTTVSIEVHGDANVVQRKLLSRPSTARLSAAYYMSPLHRHLTLSMALLMLPRISSYAVTRASPSTLLRPAAAAAVSRGGRALCTVAEPAAAAVASSSAADGLKRTKVGPLPKGGRVRRRAHRPPKGLECASVRDLKNFSFVELNDGSSLAGMQVVAVSDLPTYSVIDELSTGAACEIVGEVVESKGAGQAIEVKATELTLVGSCDASTYPLQKKRHSLEFLRTIAHLRPRSNLFGAVSRVRSALAQGTHEFFASEGFKYVQTPLITASDCEGAGEMFRVTTLDPSELAAAAAGAAAPPAEPSMSAADLAELESKIAAQGDAVRAVKEKKKEGAAEKADVDAAVAILLDLKSQLPDAEATAAPKAEMSASSTAELFAEDFFGKQAFLTVSGQLSAENYACALGDVYTFGPTFRAEQSNTARHLAEFWMIEPEMAFADLTADMDNAEAYVKYVVKHVQESCAEDMAFFGSFVDKELLGRLEKLVEQPFARVTYTEAVELLQKEIAKDPKKWEYPDVEFGTDLVDRA